jgi:catechol 2,3-dioxygenase-like lactoylglutathione lyase family enzyme
MAQVNGLAVVLLLCDDTTRTAAFYRDVLGLTLEEQEHGVQHKHYACRLGSVYFTIQRSGDLGVTERPGTYDFLQLCFTVPDMNAFLQHLASRQVKPLHAPQHFEGTNFITLLDPDGRHVRVMTPWRE